jgi:RNA polymerase sigma factor (sigma-70 family)
MLRSRADGERLFLQQLPAIDRIIALIARRNALSASDADEFAAWARGRLTDNDYAILRKFGGRSSLPTYLSVVLGNLFRDFRNSLWGRWRPSAAAQRMGPLGIRLEELLVRDGSPLREAIGILRSAGTPESDTALARMAARLPHRTADREVALDAVSEVLADRALTPVLARDETARIEAALLDAIDALPDEDRIITRMRFWDGVSVADISRLLGLDQKPLYRRIDAIQRQLRESLSRRGVTEMDARELLSRDGWT